jgi:hypothetical protein
MATIPETWTEGQARSEGPKYVCLPYTVLHLPPIQHRHTPGRRHHISPFEYAVMSGLMIMSRAAWSDDKNRRAWAAGRDAIDQEHKLAESFKQDWRQTRRRRRHGAPYELAPTPKRRHTFTNESKYKPMLPRPESIERAGSEANRKYKEKRKKEPAPEIITVEQTRRGLLIASGLPSRGDNYNVIDAALDRLCEPIGPLPAVLTNWKLLNNGRVRLEVNGRWLDLHFKKVPWPLPVRSPTALALYLWLQSIDTSDMNQTTITLKSLSYKLGIANWGKSMDIIHAAVEAVNTHLDTLNVKLLRKYNIKLPIGYEILEDEKDSHRIRFQEIVRKGRDNVEDEDDEDIEFVRSQQRQRPKERTSTRIEVLKQKRPKIEPKKVRPRINPDLRTPRITWETLKHQHREDMKANAKAHPKPLTRTITTEVHGWGTRRDDHLTVQYEVPVDLDKEQGREAI